MTKSTRWRKENPEKWALQRNEYYSRKNIKRREKYNNMSSEEKQAINQQRNERRKLEKEKNKEVFDEKVREYSRLDILRKCGMTTLEAREWYKNNVKECAICGNINNLCIDHCHRKMIVRGVLCQKCNSGIGLLKEDINILEKAINYLSVSK